MSYWNSRGLRGSSFEDMVNLANEQYKKEKLALIQKIPTPIKPVRINEQRQITLGFFEQKSTVDYIGVMDGIPLCFDAKECGKKSFPFSNLHEHQVEFMENFDMQGGLSFLLVHFTEYEESYVLPIETIKSYYVGPYNGKKRPASFPYEAFDKRLLIPKTNSPYLNYLKTAVVYAKMKERGEAFLGL